MLTDLNLKTTALTYSRFLHHSANVVEPSWTRFPWWTQTGPLSVFGKLLFVLKMERFRYSSLATCPGKQIPIRWWIWIRCREGNWPWDSGGPFSGLRVRWCLKLTPVLTGYILLRFLQQGVLSLELQSKIKFTNI